MTDAVAVLAGPPPPERPLSGLRLIRTVIRNPLETLPRPVFEDDVYRMRFLGQDTLYVMSPHLIKEVLVDKAGAFVRDPTVRRALVPVLGDGILTADGASWRWQRRAAAPVFRPDRVQAFAPAMLAAAERTRDRWLALPPGREIDVGAEMMRTTFDIILETMLSGEASVDVDRIAQSITDYLDATSWMLALTMLKAPRWTPHPGKRRAERARHYLRQEILQLAGRRRHAVPRDDLLSLLLEAHDPDTDRTLEDSGVVDNLLTFIAAGHETTAIALTWCFYLLSLHPDIEQRMVEEIEAVTTGGPLRPEHAGALTFTTQVLQETLRLYPPAPVMQRMAWTDVVIGTDLVPRGTWVYVPTYAVHRHRALWRDPDAFDPDRFAPDMVKARHKYAFLPFGAGPRICIGMGFAMLEATLILATLVRATRLTLRDQHVPRLKFRVTLRPAEGMPMRLARRGIAAARTGEPAARRAVR